MLAFRKSRVYWVSGQGPQWLKNMRLSQKEREIKPVRLTQEEISIAFIAAHLSPISYLAFWCSLLRIEDWFDINHLHFGVNSSELEMIKRKPPGLLFKRSWVCKSTRGSNVSGSHNNYIEFEEQHHKEVIIRFIIIIYSICFFLCNESCYSFSTF